jgi:hypothetical protein
VGLSRFELLTPRLSSVCSNQLSYRPKHSQTLALTPSRCWSLSRQGRLAAPPLDITKRNDLEKRGRFSQN